MCFGVDGALIALYALFLGASLDSQLKIPEFAAFFWMRLGIIFFHIVVDLIQSVCSGGKGTVGTLAHMASLIAGFCYVILVLPPMGDGSLFDQDRPYIVSCGLTSPKYVTLAGATKQCLAFFSRANGVEVSTAKLIAMVVLGGGVSVSMVNAVVKREVSSEGVACCSCGEEPEAVRAKRSQVRELERDLAKFERMYDNMPEGDRVAHIFHTMGAG